MKNFFFMRMRTTEIILYSTILINDLSLVRKINNLSEYVKQEKCIHFMPDTIFLLLLTFFSKARFFNFFIV